MAATVTPNGHRVIRFRQKPTRSTLAWLIASVCIFNTLALWGAELPRDSDADWLRRASAPGVVKAVGFDDIRDWVRYRWDRSHCNPSYQVIVDGKREGCRANAWDPNVKASGSGSVRFDVLSRTGAGSGGSFAIPFGDYETHQFGANTDMWLSWRQRMSPRYLQPYRVLNDPGRVTAFKQIMISQGDIDGTESGKPILADACSEAELVVVSTYPNVAAPPYPQAYIECARYNAFEQVLTKGMFKGDPRGSKPRTRQNMRFDGAGQSNCIYHPELLDSSGCVRYRENEWITYMVHVAIGPGGSAISSVSGREQPGYVDSTYELFVAYDGQDFELVHRQDGVVIPRGQYFSGGDPTLASSYRGGWGPKDAHPRAKYGKLWLLPFMTNKDPEEDSELAFTWFDEVIVSRCRIAAPGFPAVGACETR